MKDGLVWFKPRDIQTWPAKLWDEWLSIATNPKQNPRSFYEAHRELFWGDPNNQSSPAPSVGAKSSYQPYSETLVVDAAQGIALRAVIFVNKDSLPNFASRTPAIDTRGSFAAIFQAERKPQVIISLSSWSPSYGARGPFFLGADAQRRWPDQLRISHTSSGFWRRMEQQFNAYLTRRFGALDISEEEISIAIHDFLGQEVLPALQRLLFVGKKSLAQCLTKAARADAFSATLRAIRGVILELGRGNKG
jgi:hypothetical protein